MPGDKKVDLVVPHLGESLNEAKLARWLKDVNAKVDFDEPLAELETDKVTLEVTAPVAGVLKSILVPAGESVEVGTLLGYLIPEPKEGEETLKAESPDLQSLPEQGPEGGPGPALGVPATAEVPSAVSSGVAPAPIEAPIPETMPTPQSPSADAEMKQEERVPMSPLRQSIARRLKEAQNTAAILTTINEIDMSAIMEVRERLQGAFEAKNGLKLGLMSFFVHACCVALEEVPALNAEIQGTTTVYKKYANIGIAVATEQGLVVPVIRNVQRLDFVEIEREVSRLSAKARAGKLDIGDISGGTFTISNGGVYGSLVSTPILNPPQSGILGMHKIQKRAVVVGDSLHIRPMMYVALSYDHRLVDGREAVTFLVRVKEQLEDPERMLLSV